MEGGIHSLLVLLYSIGFIHRYLGSVIFAFKTTLTTTLNHITCINTFGQGFKKTLFAIYALFTKDNNLSKTKVGVSLQKTIATCSKCETNLILAYLHRSQRHSSSQSQKCYSAILSENSKFLLRIPSATDFIFLTQF